MSVEDQLRRLKAGGLTMVLTEQNARFVSKLGDRVYILEYGAVRYEGAMCDFLANKDVRRAYLAVSERAIVDKSIDMGADSTNRDAIRRNRPRSAG